MAKTESQSKFTFYPTPKSPFSVTANPSSTFCDAINAIGSEKLRKFSFNNNILFAEVLIDDQSRMVAVMPHFPCEEIKPNGKVEAKPRKGATPLNYARDECDKENETIANMKKHDFFYVESNSPGITKIPSSLYNGKLLAVVAKSQDSLEEAIHRDGRFCEEFILFQNDERQSEPSEVPRSYKVSDYSREILQMKKRPRKRKNTDTLPGHDEHSSESETIHPSTVYSSMPPSVEEEFTDETGKAMIEDARKSAWETLVEPNPDIRKDQLDKKIASIANKFGKVADSALPVRVMPMLTEATQSVGLVKCGDSTGSCFLLTEDVIITSQHVINVIHTKRSQSTDEELYKTIFIYFDFLRPFELGACFGEVDEKNIHTGDGKLDYALCVVKRDNSAPTNLTPLGQFVRSTLPHSGLVILVGHPESKHKQLEICHILPGYNWHAKLCQRASDAEQYCHQHPGECKFNNMNAPDCVHIHKGRVLEGNHHDELPYDTSFFHGSSGSPVFNSDGHIVAMHTQGYPFYQGSKKVSLMEFGVTFAAICRDVMERHGQRGARYLFPVECNVVCESE